MSSSPPNLSSSGFPSKLAVSVVVVAHNEEAKIHACIGSLARQEAPDLDIELILVDDGSTDRTVELARQAAPGLRVVDNASQSISSNRNRGLREASHPWVAFIDADCEAPPHWLRTLALAMVQHLADGEPVAAVGGANVPPGGESRFYDGLALMLDTYIGSRGSVQGRVFDAPRRVVHLPGLNVLYRKEALEAVGGWDERFRLIGEDEDLSHRLGDQGFRLFYVPGATVVHRQRSTFRAWAKNMATYGKGRVWLLRRHPNIFELGLLIPPFLPLLLWAYLPIIALVSLWESAKKKRLDLWLHLTLLYTTTHLWYGFGQWRGLFSVGDGTTRHAPRRRLGLVVLKNAGNLGDAAIFQSVHRRLTENAAFATTDLYVVGLGPSGLDARPVPQDADGAERVVSQVVAPSEVARSVRLLSLQTWSQGLGLVWTLLCLRGLLFCGGQWIHDLKKGYHVFVCAMVAAARLLDTRVGVFAVGMGPLKAGWARAATRLAFGSNALAVVRDRGSEALCREIGLSQVLLGADPALDLTSRKTQVTRVTRGEGAADRRRVAVSPCAWFRFDNLYRRDEAVIDAMVASFLRLFQGLEARGDGIVLLPTMNPEDDALCERLIVEHGPSKTSIELVDTARLGPRDIQGWIEAVDFLISMRLHPVIFASNVGTPMAALNYAAKVEAFCDDVDLRSHLIELDDGSWWSEALDLLDRCRQDPSGGRERLSRGRQEVAARLQAAYDRLESWWGPDPSSPTLNRNRS